MGWAQTPQTDQTSGGGGKGGPECSGHRAEE